MIGSAGLAVAAAFSFASYTVILERGMQLARLDADVSPALAAAFLSTGVAFIGFWLIAFARGIPAAVTNPVQVAPFLIAGVAYPALFRLTYYESIDRVGASISAAIESGYPVISVVLAIAFLGEVLTPLGAAGILLIVGGAVLIQFARAGPENEESTDMISTKLADADTVDFAFPMAALVLFGAAVVLLKYGLDQFPDAVTATALTQTPAVVILGALVLWRGGKDAVSVRTPALTAYTISGVIMVAAWLLQFFALQMGTVVTVVPLLNTYALWVVAISYAIVRQIPRSPRIIVAVIAIFVGATLIQVT